jgi:DNA-directed RNA polymerase specialized sigma24 family protein
MSIAAKYRTIEKPMKMRVQKFSRQFRIDKDDLEGVAREAFLRSLDSYNPQFGAQEYTWQMNVINQAIYDECKRIARARSRLEPIDTFAVGVESHGRDRWDMFTAPDFCIAEIELENSLKELSKSAQTFARERMAGYNRHEILKFGKMGRKKIDKAQAELVKFASEVLV